MEVEHPSEYQLVTVTLEDGKLLPATLTDAEKQMFTMCSLQISQLINKMSFEFAGSLIINADKSHVIGKDELNELAAKLLSLAEISHVRQEAKSNGSDFFRSVIIANDSRNKELFTLGTITSTTGKYTTDINVKAKVDKYLADRNYKIDRTEDSGLFEYIHVRKLPKSK